MSRFEAARSSAMARHEARRSVGVATATGVYFELASDPHHELTVESLGDRRSGIEVRNITAADSAQLATVFVPEGRLARFIRKVETYRDKETDSGKPKNQKLIESITDIRLAALESFWTDDKELFPAERDSIAWEVWLRRTDGVEAEIARLATVDGVEVLTPRFDFVELSVFLISATPKALTSVLDLLDLLAELRLAKSAASFLERRQERHDLLEAILPRVTTAPADAPAVCILDGGVDRGHPLLAGSLAARDDHRYDPTWPLGDTYGHGTEMAGLALFGDLIPVVASRDPIVLEHRLESVKAIHGPAPHQPQNYGHVTKECVARAETTAPQRERVVSMTIASADSRDRGRPSLWSAAVDDVAAGTSDETRRLFDLAAGNIDPIEKHLRYPDVNHVEPVHDPGQAWNALTIGAYAERVVITEPSFAGWAPIASRGELSPVSTTSVTWETRRWPIKPELALDGGNTARDPSGTQADSPESLSLLTTRPEMRGLFGATGDTSAAGAAGARLAALVMCRYPGTWPETVRALLVHSAEHTSAMVDQAAPQRSRADRERMLRIFGYGVPRLERALASAANDLTLIVEGELQPFTAAGAMNEMHVHELPWPRAELAALGAVEVELTVTLSYFVEASPGRRGWGQKHRYASHGLRFDVRTPTESLDEFRARVNHAARSDDVDDSSSDAAKWWLGPTVRCKGSLHHDRWRGTAADLAERWHIAVFPVLGWWRERRHLGRAERKARYSLVVSIRAPEVEVDLYAPVAALVAAAAPVEVET